MRNSQELEKFKRDLAEKLGVSIDDLEKLILEKRKEFGDLISDMAALILIGKEHGIVFKEELPEIKKVFELHEVPAGLRAARIRALVVKVKEEKVYEREDGVLRLWKALLKSLETPFTAWLIAWNEAIENVRSLEPGDIVVLSNVRTRKGKYGLEICVREDTAVEQVQKLTKFVHKIVDLKRGDVRIKLIGVVKSVEEGYGKTLITVSDGSGDALIVTSEVVECVSGDIIKVVDGKVIDTKPRTVIFSSQKPMILGKIMDVEKLFKRDILAERSFFLVTFESLLLFKDIQLIKTPRATFSKGVMMLAFDGKVYTFDVIDFHGKIVDSLLKEGQMLRFKKVFTFHMGRRKILIIRRETQVESIGDLSTLGSNEFRILRGIVKRAYIEEKMRCNVCGAVVSYEGVCKRCGRKSETLVKEVTFRLIVEEDDVECTLKATKRLAEKMGRVYGGLGSFMSDVQGREVCAICRKIKDGLYALYSLSLVT